MKTLRINRVKAFIRKYRSSKITAVREMYSGDLNTYMDSLIQLSKSKEDVQSNLIPALSSIY